MRKISLAIALLAAVIPASAIASQCALSDKSSAAPSITTCQPSSIGLQATASAAVRYAQYAPGGCRFRGQRTCINGWLAVCQCYSYGCNFMATGTRCGR